MGNRIGGRIRRKMECEMLFDCHSAAGLGNEEYFVKCTRDVVLRRNAEGWTPLMYACSFGHARVVELLLRRGAVMEACDNTGRTAVMLTAANGYTAILRILLQSSPADVLSAVDSRGWTAIFHAAHMGQTECLELLIQHNCNVHARALQSGETVLMVAVRCGNPDVVKTLLCSGADATIVTRNGTTALGIAEALGFIKIADMLWISIVRPRWGCMKLSEFLNFLNHGKYHMLFCTKNIDFIKFLAMTEEDLKETGVVLLGPRKKMVLAISKWHFYSETYKSSFIDYRKLQFY